MTDKGSPMYKYKCRGCPVQERCIEESGLAQGAREMIRNAFAARTDTLSTWDVLQRNCLLVNQDEDLERRMKNGSSVLSRRISKAQVTNEAADEPDAEQSPVDHAQMSVMIGEDSQQPSSGEGEIDDPPPTSTAADTLIKTPRPGTLRLDPDSFTTRALETAPFDSTDPSGPAAPCWLVMTGDSGRRISLPGTGMLIIGRFDPYVEDPLDIDLAFEDQHSMTVSRRHARIVGLDGRHTLEDLGSSNGSSINGRPVEPGQPHPLQPGDLVALGGIKMTYQTIPAEFFSTLMFKAGDIRHLLYLTQVGRKIEIASPNNIIIGRSDPEANYMPSLDLGKQGDVSTYVSRRHAVITWSNGSPHFKDLQSTYGTRINGETLPPNEPIPLSPGDHMSLGGCVLAYDVEA